ncbi:protein FAM136A-like [Drosophila miranda]|uniref:protein FAM136A-like n=1 Tax=Drosophila miranda TaxID=7229 RepID=UPI00143F4623|nr:protein FAM136A-like [Drosophila miranda]
MMIQQQRQRIESAVTEMIDDMDKTHLRKMQNEMHLCAAKCCQDDTSSVDSVQRCVDRCSTPMTRAQNYVQQELGEFQGRLQRCVMQCNDDVKVKMPLSPSEEQIAKYTDQFERCAIQCVDKHVGLIPSMMKTMKKVLSKGPEAIPQV